MSGDGISPARNWFIQEHSGGAKVHALDVSLAATSINAGPGCTSAAGGTEVTCAGPITSGVIDLRSMNAGQAVNVFANITFGMQMIGSQLDDTLSGGSGDDHMIGLQGGDWLRGNGGNDTAVYNSEAANGAVETDRVEGVDVTIDDVANDGTFGYDGYSLGGGTKGADNVDLTTENVYGTEYADTLAGSDGPNLLSGRPGADVLTGGPGSDKPIGQFGPDTLNAKDNEADAEVNCNNSDDSRDQQPNTVNYDRGLDNPVNCALAAEASATRVQDKLKVVDKSGSWTIPESLMPKKKGGKWSYTARKNVARIVKEAGFPVTVTFKEVGRPGVPQQYRQPKMVNGSVVRVSPVVGTAITGSSTNPAELVVTTFSDKVKVPAACPYDDLAEIRDRVNDEDLPSALRQLKRMRCKWVISETQFTEKKIGQPEVRNAKVQNEDGTPRVSLSVLYPEDTLRIEVSPGGSGDQLTLDQDGKLRLAPKNLTTIRVRAFDSSFGIPATKNTTVEIRGPGGKVLASQTVGGASGNGVQTLTFGVREFAALRVRVLAFNDSKTMVLHGNRTLLVSQAKGPFATADMRCFRWKRSTEKWKVKDCFDATAKANGARENANAMQQPEVVSKEVARLVAERLIADNEMGEANTYAEALAFCKAAAPLARVTVPSTWYWDPTAPGPAGNFACTQQEMVQLMKHFNVRPVILSGSSKADGNPALAAAREMATVGVVEGTLREGTAPAIDLSKGPVVGIDRGGVITFGGGVFLDARKGLPAGELINLDGGSLINLDTGTLIGLDASGLEVIDSATLIAAGGLNLKALDPEVVNLLGGATALPGGQRLIAAGGQNLIAAGGQNLIAAGGQNLIAAGGQNLVTATGPLKVVESLADTVIPVQELIRLPGG